MSTQKKVPFPDVPGYYIAQKKNGEQDMLLVLKIRGPGELEISSPQGSEILAKPKVSQYNVWYRVGQEPEKRLSRRPDNVWVYSADPSLPILKMPYEVSHDLRDLSAKPNLSWYLVNSDETLRSIDKVAVYEVTLKNRINTFIGVLSPLREL